MSNHMNTDEEKEKAVADALAVRARFAASPLMDGKRIARAIEALTDGS